MEIVVYFICFIVGIRKNRKYPLKNTSLLRVWLYTTCLWLYVDNRYYDYYFLVNPYAHFYRIWTFISRFQGCVFCFLFVPVITRLFYGKGTR